MYFPIFNSAVCGLGGSVIAPIFENVFYEVAILLAVAFLLGLIALRLRQPLILAFIAVGMAIGPSGLGWVRSHDKVDLLASMGIALLLFVVGLKLDLGLIRSLGPVALATGLGQVLFTSVIGYGIALLLGMDHVSALYVAVALTFSSTIIIVKLLSDKREIDALHGRIAVGFLIVQDIVVILLMITLSAFGLAGTREGSPLEIVTLTLLRGVGVLACVGVLMKYALSPMLHRIARSPELLMLFAITWAVFLAAVTDYLGFSREVGAFLAGVSIASTPYREAINARLVGLRDFLLLFFFISLGAHLDLGLLNTQFTPALIFSLFVLIGNPLIVMAIMGAMGYRKRTGFLAGLTVAQISEFSLILGALGLSLGHINAETLGLITLVGLITIGLSTYLILYSHPLFSRLSPWLGIFERRSPARESSHDDLDTGRQDYQVILFGLGRFGSNIGHRLEQRGVRVLGVDFDPQTVTAWQNEGLSARYGDAEDPEFFSLLPLAGAAMIVSTVPQVNVNITMLHTLSNHNFGGKVAVTAHTDQDAAVLKKRGALIVFRPFVDAAEQAIAAVTDALRNAGQDRPAS